MLTDVMNEHPVFAARVSPSRTRWTSLKADIPCPISSTSFPRSRAKWPSRRSNRPRTRGSPESHQDRADPLPNQPSGGSVAPRARGRWARGIHPARADRRNAIATLTGTAKQPPPALSCRSTSPRGLSRNLTPAPRRRLSLYAQPRSFMARPACQILVMWTILSPSNCIT